MRYSRLLAWLLLVFVVVGVGAQLLRHALPLGGVKTRGVSRVASSAIATVAGTVASDDASASSVPSTTRKPSKASSQATTRSSPATSRSTAAPAATGRPAGSAPSHFRTLAPGASLPTGGQCAAWVRARPLPERKAVNRPFNQVTGQRVSGLFDPGATDPRATSRIAARIDGDFTGTTQEILRWAACKWGIDEDLVYAQAAVESWWRQTTQGDLGSDAAACAPGHGLGADGTPGQCPQSFGILQNRYPFERSTWPGIARSTAMNADTAYGIWRACFEGYEHWLNDVDRGRQYGAGDALGCMGRWFAGRWHTAAGDQYVTRVKDDLARRIWETPDFQER
jgi:hypothetical protein